MKAEQTIVGVYAMRSQVVLIGVGETGLVDQLVIPFNDVEVFTVESAGSGRSTNCRFVPLAR